MRDQALRCDQTDLQMLLLLHWLGTLRRHGCRSGMGITARHLRALVHDQAAAAVHLPLAENDRSISPGLTRSPGRARLSRLPLTGVAATVNVPGAARAPRNTGLAAFEGPLQVVQAA